MSKKNLFGMLAMGAVSIGSIVTIFKLSQNSIQTKERRVQKFKSYYNILNVWLDIKQKGGSLEKYFIDNGYDEAFGARPLKRLVSNKLETLLATKLINNEIKSNNTVTVDYKDNNLIIK